MLNELAQFVKSAEALSAAYETLSPAARTILDTHYPFSFSFDELVAQAQHWQDAVCRTCDEYAPTHTQDENCAPFLTEDGGYCVVCGVGGGESCSECHQSLYHRPACTLSDANA